MNVGAGTCPSSALWHPGKGSCSYPWHNIKFIPCVLCRALQEHTEDLQGPEVTPWKDQSSGSSCCRFNLKD